LTDLQNRGVHDILIACVGQDSREQSHISQILWI